MKVKELIAELSKYDEDMEVEVLDNQFENTSKIGTPATTNQVIFRGNKQERESNLNYWYHSDDSLSKDSTQDFIKSRKALVRKILVLPIRGSYLWVSMVEFKHSK